LARLLIRGEQGEDIRHDIDRSFAREVKRGLDLVAARRRYARNVLGSAWSVLAAGLSGFVAHGVLGDFRVGLRMLARQPLLTLVAMLALALGIPAALSVNHALDVLFGPLPVPEGERVMGLRYWDLEEGAARGASVRDYELWSESLESFEALGAARSFTANVRAGDGGAPPVRAAEVTASTFDLLRATPLLGRMLSEADEAPDGPEVILIGEDLWASQFAADPDIVGRDVLVGTTRHTVVGVMPSSFEFPDGNDVWLPLWADPAEYPAGEGPRLWVYGRLADGADVEDAMREIELVTARAAADDPARLERVVGEVVDMPVLFFGDTDIRASAPIVIVQSVMLLLLFLICGNVGTLLLARTVSRSGELSIRAALGASRLRIVTQLFVEALVLTVCAAGVGLLLMEAVIYFLARTVEPFGLLPYWVDPHLTPRIGCLALGLAVLSAAVAGVIPALKATGKKVQANLQQVAARGATLRFGLGSTALIVTEVVLSVGFLAMGSVLIRSVFQSTEGDLGLDPERYVNVWLSVSRPEEGGSTPAIDDEAFDVRVRQTQVEVLERLRSEQGIVGVGLGLHHPASEGALRNVVVESPSGSETRSATRFWESRVGVEYLRGLNRPVLAGRYFTDADLQQTTGVRPVIVNTRFVEEALNGRNPVGVRFRLAAQGDAAAEDEEWFEIVGVVGPFGMYTLNPTRDAGYYLPVAPGAANPMGYLVEVAGEPEAFLPRFREIAAEVDPEAMTEGFALADGMRRESRVLRGLFSAMVLIAAVAFLLAVTGLYALMSFTVSQRTREIGIRVALGARPSDIVFAVARRAAAQLGLGLILGAGLGWLLLGTFMQQELAVQVSRPLTLAATVACAAVVGTVACLKPTLRGLRIRPTEALGEL
jgi:predicted permease